MIFSWLLISSNEEDVWLESKLCQILIELPQFLRWPLCYVTLHAQKHCINMGDFQYTNKLFGTRVGRIKVTFHVNLCKCRNLKCWSYGQQGADATSALSLWDFCCIWAQVTLIPFNLWRWPEPDLQSFLSHSLCTHLDLLILLPFQHCTLCRFQALIVSFVHWKWSSGSGR